MTAKTDFIILSYSKQPMPVMALKTSPPHVSPGDCPLKPNFGWKHSSHRDSLHLLDHKYWRLIRVNRRDFVVFTLRKIEPSGYEEKNSCFHVPNLMFRSIFDELSAWMDSEWWSHVNDQSSLLLPPKSNLCVQTPLIIWCFVTLCAFVRCKCRVYVLDK